MDVLIVVPCPIRFHTPATLSACVGDGSIPAAFAGCRRTGWGIHQTRRLGGKGLASRGYGHCTLGDWASLAHRTVVVQFPHQYCGPCCMPSELSTETPCLSGASVGLCDTHSISRIWRICVNFHSAPQGQFRPIRTSESNPQQGLELCKSARLLPFHDAQARGGRNFQPPAARLRNAKVMVDYSARSCGCSLLCSCCLRSLTRTQRFVEHTGINHLHFDSYTTEHLHPSDPTSAISSTTHRCHLFRLFLPRDQASNIHSRRT